MTTKYWPDRFIRALLNADFRPSPGEYSKTRFAKKTRSKGRIFGESAVIHTFYFDCGGVDAPPRAVAID